MVRTEAFGMKICIAYVTHRENKNVEKRSINFHERQVFEIRRSLKNTNKIITLRYEMFCEYVICISPLDISI